MNETPRVIIARTPAALDDGPAGQELAQISATARGGKLSDAALQELRSGGWLQQTSWTRGGYFTTKGIREATGRPELALLNVPSAFEPWAHRLLNEISDYILDTGAVINSGEIMAMPDEDFAELRVAFALVEPGELESPPFGQPMLVVVPLP